MNLAVHKELNIPKKPGVYFFMEGETILYIGKATNLYERTKSYLNSNLMSTRGPLIVKMIDDATDIQYKETETVLEALLLESHLIKKNQPYYNSREKDNKSYNYVVVTNEDFPRVFSVRKRQLDILQGKNNNSILHSFGPFPQGNLLIEALKIIKKIFPFYGKRGQGSYAHQFYRQMGLEPDGSASSFSQQYKENISYIADFFEGKKRSIIIALRKKMKSAASSLKFEKAEIYKRQIYSLEHIRDVALMKKDFELGTESGYFRIEAYDIAHHQGDNMVGVMVVHNGTEIDSSEHRLFTIRSTTTADDTKALSETIDRRIKHTQWAYPSIIVVDGALAQKKAAEKVLRSHNLKIPVVAVVKDDKHKAKGLLGKKNLLEKYKDQIIALNAESHRFAINAHKKKRSNSFLS